MCSPAVSLILPAFCEEKRLPRSIARLREYLDREGFSFDGSVGVEVLIVVEKSHDRTAEVALELTRDDARFRVIANDVQRGKGYAVKCGMLAARGRVRIFMDADLSTDLSEVRRFVDHMAANPNAPVVIGDRKQAQSEIGVQQTPLRRLSSRVFNQVVRAATGFDFRDTQCGFKAFRAAAATALFSRLETFGFAFDVELLMRANRLGFGVEALGVKWSDDASSKIRIVRDSLKMLREVARLTLSFATEPRVRSIALPAAPQRALSLAPVVARASLIPPSRSEQRVARAA